LCNDWSDAESAEEKVVGLLRKSGDYAPGQFYKRALLCILAALAEIDRPVHTIMVDSYVQLGPSQPGLGQKLVEHLKLKQRSLPPPKDISTRLRKPS